MLFKTKATNRRGFTIVELMIAISVFSVIATLVLVGVLFVSRQYQQASNRTEIEEASRAFHAQVLQAIQYSGGDKKGPYTSATGDYKGECIGNQMFIYGAKTVGSASDYDSQTEGLYVINDISDCNVDAHTPASEQNILPDGAKVVNLDIDTTSGTVKTTFVKSGSDLLDFSTPTSVKCQMAVSGREWCAVVSFESTGMRRIQ